jgi:putative transcriptional regulator
MKNPKTSPMMEAILASADGLHSLGIMDDAAYARITFRHLDKFYTAAAPISGEEIRQIRERAQLSQAMFARCLNVTTRYVSQLELGTKRPIGAALALLNVIRRKGIEVVL